MLRNFSLDLQRWDLSVFVNLVSRRHQSCHFFYIATFEVSVMCGLNHFSISHPFHLSLRFISPDHSVSQGNWREIIILFKPHIFDYHNFGISFLLFPPPSFSVTSVFVNTKRELSFWYGCDPSLRLRSKSNSSHLLRVPIPFHFSTLEHSIFFGMLETYRSSHAILPFLSCFHLSNMSVMTCFPNLSVIRKRSSLVSPPLSTSHSMLE